MKSQKIKNTKIALALIALASSLLVASLTGCSEASDAQGDKLPATQSESNESSATDPNQMQIEYYEKLIGELEAMLLNEKQENYIEISEYKQLISTLEAKIEAISKSEETAPPSQTPLRDPNLNDQLSIAPPNVNQPNNDRTPSQGDIIYQNEVITGYRGDSLTLAVPSSIDGVHLTSIGEGAFRGNKIEKITISDGIIEIDWFAFADCKSLAEIYIPSSVTSIGYGAFENCSSFLVIKCEKGSYAEAYARSWGILVISE